MLLSEGKEVTVVTGIPNYPDGKIHETYGFFKRRRENLNGAKIKRLFLIPRGSGSKFRLIINYLSYFFSCFFYTLYLALFRKKYDVVFVHHTSPILIAISPIVYKWIRRPKMILWDLDLWPDTLIALNVLKEGKLSRLLDKIVTWIYRKYDHVLIGSRSFADKATTRIDKSKIGYFPNWAEDVFTKNKIVTPNSQPELPAGFSLMYTGNIGEAQDFDTIFKAMEALKTYDINWILVGGGRKRKRLEKLIKEAQIEQRVTFTGNQPINCMPYFFSKADVMFLSLQDQEIFSKTVPAKLQAYMAGGKPIVGMLNGEGQEIIKKANCGLCADSGKAKEFTEAILELFHNQERLSQLGLNGQEYYKTNFSKDTRKKQLVNLIDEN